MLLHVFNLLRAPKPGGGGRSVPEWRRAAKPCRHESTEVKGSHFNLWSKCLALLKKLLLSPRRWWTGWALRAPGDLNLALPKVGIALGATSNSSM